MSKYVEKLLKRADHLRELSTKLERLDRTIQARKFLACAKHVERKAYGVLGERQIDNVIHGAIAKLATS